jgi:hypothetical protein
VIKVFFWESFESFESFEDREYWLDELHVGDARPRGYVLRRGDARIIYPALERTEMEKAKGKGDRRTENRHIGLHRWHN